MASFGGGSSSSRSPGYVVGYYPSWKHYRQGGAKYKVNDFPAKLCTHAIYAFATLDPDTLQAKTHDKYLDIDLNNYRNFVRLKEKNPRLKVLLGLGGGTDSQDGKYSRMASNPDSRKRFVQGVVRLLQEYGFDGLDLDWEYPGSGDREAFTRLVEDLRNALPRDLLLTAAVSPSRYVIDSGYDVPRVERNLDFINLMAYNFHGSWENFVAHHAPLHKVPRHHDAYNADFAVNHWIQKGAPPEKVVLGVPFYGRSFTLASSANSLLSPASGAGKPGRYSNEAGSLSYLECELALREGWRKNTDGPYLYSADQWVGYDDRTAVKQKAEYARNKGLGGIMVWDVASDDNGNVLGNGSYPLLREISQTLRT